MNTNTLEAQSPNPVTDELITDELSLDDIMANPVLNRIAQQIESDVRTTSHTAHNSHYSSNS